MTSRPAGKVRSSEIITTFGPGSIFYGKDGVSVMILGLDAWPEAFSNKEELSKFKIIQNQFLEAVCNKDHFRMPISEDGFGGGIPCVAFPTWGYCEFCKIMSEVSGKPDQETGYYVCKYCQRKYGRKNRILSARLIRLCDHGHVQDFPWIEWAHSKTKHQDAGICEKPIVEWRFGQGGTTLSNYWVRCKTCSKSRSMFGATEPLTQILPSKNGGTLELKCNGHAPWLGKNLMCPPKKVEDREKKYMKGNHVRASNMYFPIIVSALQIPRFENPIQKAIDKNRQIIDYLREQGKSLEDIAQEKFLSKADSDARKILEELRYRFENLVDDEHDIKVREYNDMMHTSDIPFHREKVISISNAGVHHELMPYISNVKKLDRLTMIQTLRSFTRGNPPDPYYSKNTDTKSASCRISKSRKIDWLPCVETRGEGILLTLNEARIREWEKESFQRRNKIIDASEKFNSQRGWSGEIHPNYPLLHTLSHILIRALADNSGYGESSISERIYSGENMNAILLYTSSNSSEGSLGGLVRNATPEDFCVTVKSAIEKSRSCSRDPLCRESSLDEGSLHTRLNGSACYACTLLPETSCENFNKLLDRGILTDDKIGFFSGFE